MEINLSESCRKSGCEESAVLQSLEGDDQIERYLYGISMENDVARATLSPAFSAEFNEQTLSSNPDHPRFVGNVTAIHCKLGRLGCLARQLTDLPFCGQGFDFAVDPNSDAK